MPDPAEIEKRRTGPGNVLAGPGARGERIRLEGVVYDGVGAPVNDGMVEIWQANADGRYDHPEDTQDRPLDPAFSGFGRAVADFETGVWWFETVKPGPVPSRHGRAMAAHVNAIVFARGINVGLHTRIYFDDEEAANAADPVVALVEPADRRATLLARRGGRVDDVVVYRLDIRLQGEGETVFLDV
jgi:protocatechuate 3,4-dioxygenase alpha subunit